MLIFLLLIGIIIILCIAFVSGDNSTKPITNRLPSDLYNWLEEADECYIRSYCQKDIKYFAPYATSEVVEEIYDGINVKPEKLFGTRRYRNREWCLVSVNSNIITVNKTLTHQHIDVGAGVKVPLGDNLKQSWTILKTSKSYTVSCIEEC